MRELTLASHFAVVPATVDGLKTLATHFDLIADATQSPSQEMAAPVPSLADEITHFRSYLGADVFQWLCACAIYPELQWGLTLTLGALPSMPPGLVSEANLTKLLRLEWFRNGSIPDDRRRELIAQLDPRVERDVREAIIHVLEDSPTPGAGVTASAQNFQIAYQRARLAPRDRKTRTILNSAVASLAAHETFSDRAYLDFSESKSRSPLHLLLPKSLRTMFYPAGEPALKLRLSAGLAMAILGVILGLQTLHLIDRSTSMVLTVTRPEGGTILGPGIECGTGGSRCSASVSIGESLELNVRPDRDYVFSGYTGDCAPAGRTSMTGPRTCGATFEPVMAARPPVAYRLTIRKPEHGTVVFPGGILCGTYGASCSADIASGVPVALRAVADAGYSLQQFTGDCPTTGEMTMTSAKTCGVAFVRGPAPVVSGPASPSVGSASAAATAPGDTPAVAVAPSQGGLEIIQGETDKAYKARMMAATKKYANAVALLAAGDYEQALSLFLAIMNEVPAGYRDLAQRREEARAGLRSQAKLALEDAQAAEKQRNFDAAIEGYRRAHRLDPTIAIDSEIEHITAAKLSVIKTICLQAQVESSVGGGAVSSNSIQVHKEVIRLVPTTDPCYVTSKEILDKIEPIVSVLYEYAAALEARDVGALKRLWLNMNESAEAAYLVEFAQSTRIQAAIVNYSLTVSGDTATMTFIRDYRVTINGQTRQSMGDASMELKQSGDKWLIVRLVFKPFG